MQERNPPQGRTSRGSALLASLVTVMVLVSVTASVFMVNLAHKQETAGMVNRTRAGYLAETGVNESLLALATSAHQGTAAPSDVGTVDAPRTAKGGRFWCDIAPNGDGSYTVLATGASNLARRSIEAVIAPVGSIYDHAIFAGNTSGDPAYALTLGGSGGQADSIVGDIYSAGDVVVAGDAGVSGGILAGGSISGSSGSEGVSRPLPDIDGMDYATNNDFDVASMFSSATWASDPLGGSAWQLPADNPAHIFRKNPSDRTDETSSTEKDDFFLEDPTMPVSDFTVGATGMQGHTISLSGTMGKPGPSGTDKVYYVDGNLWVHNKPFGGLRFRNTDPDGARVTFVVKGNIYFSDDVYMDDDAKDGVAFIAIQDEDVDDSGNIYMGDPRYGTLNHMEAYLYAQNNFYDNNLDDTGSSVVTLVGNMTAGNQVAISRDYEKSDGTVEHSRLEVEFDPRVSTGALDLPGLPRPVGGVEGYQVVYWRETSPL